ncbi:MAG: phosphatidylglycerophosphatase A [Betaproteobacteria bacterium]|nr:phosphatidylglycerophosphatase A [Betaproteobacteria bacterium]
MTPFPHANPSRFMWSHPAHPFALGFGSGLSPVAPGTVGTLWAWASYSLLSLYLDTAELGCMVLAAFVLGCWFCKVTAEHLQVHDPSAIVWDEIAAFWLVLWVWMPASMGGQLLAFVLFRLFDVVKPGPVGWADRSFHGLGWRGGFGIMLDDVVAAFCTLLCLALWQATR